MNLYFPPIDDNFPILVPPLRKLVEELTDCDEQGLSLRCVVSNLRACDVVLSAFFAGFKRSLDHSVCDATEAELVAKAIGIFGRLGQIMTVTYKSIQADDHDLTVLNIIAMIESVRELEQVLEKQHDYHCSKPKLSSVSGLHDILEAGQAVLSGQKGWDLLVSRLERMRPLAEKLCANTNNPTHVEEHCLALQQLFAVCASGDLEALPAALESFKTTGEAFMTTQTNLQMAETLKPLCPGCGAAVEKWDVSCPACGSALPHDELASGATVNGSFELPQDLECLLNEADALRLNGDGLDEFKIRVQGIIDTAIATHEKISGFANSDENSTVEERELIREIRELLSASSSHSGKALEALAALDLPLDVTALDNGLEILVAAVDETRQALLMARRLKALRES